MPRPQSHWDDVRSYLVQKGEANAGVVALFVPERLTEKISLARGTEARARQCRFFISGEPSWRSDDEYASRLIGPILRPFRPAFVRTFGMFVEIELIQLNRNRGLTQRLPEQANGSRVLNALVAVADEERGSRANCRRFPNAVLPAPCMQAALVYDGEFRGKFLAAINRLRTAWVSTSRLHIIWLILVESS
jgi:hypothetical protein